MASFWCLYCQLWTFFTPCSSVSINFEYVIAGWAIELRHLQRRTRKKTSAKLQPKIERQKRAKKFHYLNRNVRAITECCNQRSQSLMQSYKLTLQTQVFIEGSLRTGEPIGRSVAGTLTPSKGPDTYSEAYSELDTHSEP